jgi:hypothetical protein
MASGIVDAQIGFDLRNPASTNFAIHLVANHGAK